MSPIILIGGGLILVLLIVGVVVTMRSESELVEERIDKYLEGADELEFGSSEDLEDTEKPSVLIEWINGLVERTDYGSKISDQLARADMKFKPGEYVAIMIIASFAGGVLAFFFGGGVEAGTTSKIFALVGLVIGAFVPRIFVKRTQSKRLKNFDNQLADMLNLMVNGMRAGFSTMQAMEAVSKELPPPMSTEFRRVVQEMQLGIPMDVALDNLLSRIPSEDLDLVITAINVQREVGGNLAEVLETISHTVRERVRIKGEIKTLTTQVVTSGRILSLIPVALMGLLWLVNRQYFNQFFVEPKWCGITIMICSAIMILIGYLVMNKIADIEV